jgi:hypothetical protein
MNAFTNYTAITFRFIQGATTLLSQQNAAFEKLISTFVDDVGVQGPLSTADIELHEHAGAYVSSGSFSVLKVSIREYLVGLASWVEEIIEKADASTQDKLLTDIGRVVTVACDRIHSICVLRTEDNIRRSVFVIWSFNVDNFGEISSNFVRKGSLLVN